MSIQELGDEFTEINYPIEMIPIITKDDDILWYKARLIGNNGVLNVDNSLHTTFSNIFNRLKIYIDAFNVTYFIYKDTLRMYNDQNEDYDKIYGLSDELEAKLDLYKSDLRKHLSIIHDKLNELNDVLEIKHRLL